MAIFDRSVSRVTGPLACYAAGFSAELGARGYGQDAIYLHLRLIAELSAWLSVQELDAGQLSPAVTDRFVTGIRATCRRLVSARALAPILGYLHDLGVLGEAEAEPANERDALLAAYQQYLRRERGVGERTVHGYAPHAAEFLAGVGDRLDEALRELTGPEVLAILKEQLRKVRHRSAASAAAVVKADRSLLRFLHADGRVPRELSPVIPPVARWRLAGLPARLSAATVTALLGSCDRSTEHGRRDYAVMLLFTRLGLRAIDVARLTLDDFNWRAGEVTIHGKGGRTDIFPVPVEVGAAVADYLRTRRPPHPASRAVFLTVVAPRRGLGSLGAGSIVHSACRRAGVPDCGPSRLRHSLASDLLAAGASLADVGEILRHSDPRTTVIYAKVDRTALAALVRPWPARVEEAP